MFCNNCDNTIIKSDSCTDLSGTPTVSSESTHEKFCCAEQKKFLQSRLVLVCSVVFSISIILSIFFRIYGNSLLCYIEGAIFGEALFSLFKTINLTNSFIKVGDLINLIFTVIIDLPNVLISIGFWMTIIPSFDTDQAPLPSIGVKLINVVVKVQIIISYIVEGMLFFFFGELISRGMGIAVIPLFFLMIVCFPATTCAYKFFVETITCIENNLEKSIASYNEISEFVIWFCIIKGTLGVLTLSLYGISNILFGITLYILKYKMRYINIISKL